MCTADATDMGPDAGPGEARLLLPLRLLSAVALGKLLLFLALLAALVLVTLSPLLPLAVSSDFDRSRSGASGMTDLYVRSEYGGVDDGDSSPEG